MRVEGPVTRRYVRLARRTSKIAKTIWLVCGVIAALAQALLSVDSAFAVAAANGLSWLGMSVLFVTSFVLNATGASRPGAVEVHAGNVVLDYGSAQRAISRSTIASAYVVARGAGPTVEIELAGGDLYTVETATTERAHELVGALGFAPGGRRVSLDLEAPKRRFLHLAAAWGSYVLGTVLSWIMLALLLLSNTYATVAWVQHATLPAATLGLYWLVRKLIAAPRFTLGADGVWIEVGFRRRFVPRGEIASVARDVAGSASALILRSGATVPLTGTIIDRDRGAAIGDLVSARYGATANDAADRGAMFERRGRTLDEWRDDIARRMEETGYRAAGVTADHPRSVLESPHATRDQRVGAALALRIAGEPAEKIRVVADASADPILREALAAVAEDAEPERLEKATRRLG